MARIMPVYECLAKEQGRVKIKASTYFQPFILEQSMKKIENVLGDI
ncbi:hypothetical protein EZS27_020248 [termite gut metagenome]|uniref:Uncharacterized protein n=1 Tax=termite gut metagenome TaxID=433724 RepID=A0A5J4RAL3_9ZZZZ